MKRVILSIACSTAIVMVASVAAAQGKGGGPNPKATSAAVTRGGAAARVTAKPGGGASAHAGAAKTAHGGGKATATPVKSEHGAGRSKTTETARTRKGSPTTTATTLTPVQQKLQRNTSLAQKLQARLPAGTDLNTAAAGFRNLGQFVAAVNVSNNLGLDFTTLKTAMVDDGKSLGQAIQAQRRSVDATSEAGRAQRDGNALIRSTESASAKKSPEQKATRDGRR